MALDVGEPILRISPAQPSWQDKQLLKPLAEIVTADGRRAARNRRYYRNRRLGIRSRTIRITDGELARLVAKGYLTARGDRKAEIAISSETCFSHTGPRIACRQPRIT